MKSPLWCRGLCPAISKISWVYQASPPTAIFTAEEKWRRTPREGQREISLCNSQWEVKLILDKLRGIRWAQYGNGTVSLCTNHCRMNCGSIWVVSGLLSLRSHRGLWPSTVGTQAFCEACGPPCALRRVAVHKSSASGAGTLLLFAHLFSWLSVDFKEIWVKWGSSLRIFRKIWRWALVGTRNVFKAD